MSFLKRNKFLLIVFIFAVVAIFVNLGKMPLFDPDEPVYAETAKEMRLFHDFLSPRIYGEYWYDKPPMYYWLTAAAQSVFGENEWSARFPSAVMGFLTVMVLFFAVKKMFNEKIAFCSSLILLTSLEFFYLSKGAVTDTTLTFFLTCAMFAFITKKYYWFYVSAGFAVLTKGPVGIFLPCMIIFSFILLKYKEKEWQQMKIIKGLLLFLIIAVPWYLLMFLKHGSVFIDTFLGFHNVTRFLTAEHPETNNFLFYFGVLALGFFPWIVLLPQTFYSLLFKKEKFMKVLQVNKERRSGEDTALIFCLWFSMIFVFFTISQTKLISYILPVFPPIAVLVACYIECLRENLKKTEKWLWQGFFLVFVIIFNVAFFKFLKAEESVFANLRAVILLFDLMFVLTVCFLWYKKVFYAFMSKVLVMVFFAVFLGSYLLVPIADDLSTKKLAQEFKKQYGSQNEVYISKFLRPGFAYYADIYGNEVNKENLVEKLNDSSTNVFYVLTELDFKRFKLEIEKNSRINLLLKENQKVFLYKK